MAIVINGSGTVTGLAVGGLPDGTVDADTLAANSVVTGKITDGAILNADINASAAIAGTKINGSFGKVLQVQSFAFTGTTDTTVQDNTFVDTGLTVNITPTSTSSKVLVMVSIGRIGSSHIDRMANIRLVRGTTNILLGDAASPRTLASAGSFTSHTGGGNSVSMNYLDSPATTSATTYKVTYSGSGAETVKINYGRNDGNTDGHCSRVASTITVMEIGA